MTAKTNLLSLLFVLIGFVSCQDNNKKTQVLEKTEEEIVVNRMFPANIDRVFEAHGGYAHWAQQQYLTFTLPKPDGNEIHQIDLRSRKDRIHTDKFSLGFDGEEVWIKQDSTYFGGNPRFYHNLMFYFYAMPFVLGDPGVIYEPAEDLVYQDTIYKGLKISFEAEVGDTPEDNYFLYYHPETGRMAWLGYTVTFFSGAPSDKVSYIHYAGWQEFNGLLLPTRLEWHEYKDGKLGKMTNGVSFTDIQVSETIPDRIVFKKPEGATTVDE
ncbi:MAG: hypothetical protein KKC03_07460 [Bacteroidetes bacterium]|nr:hypothetical protein [Bacteroidota bacterium]